mmetsp:Transcript_47156/g.81108  ORF Transcript_47156/g.81108 Transcript_47156/m.81108 type:complete len:390 (+) Transcript_47156:144-1313(+)
MDQTCIMYQKQQRTNNIFYFGIGLVFGICLSFLVNSGSFVTISGVVSQRTQRANPQSYFSNPTTHVSNPVKGIILTSQCSGSTWLTNVFNAQKSVLWKDEVLIKYSQGGHHWKTHSDHLRFWTTVSWEDYRSDLEGALSFTKQSGKVDASSLPGVVGFKLMYDQIPHHLLKPFASWLEQYQVHVIHLRRRCAVLQFASQIEKYQRKVLGDGAGVDHVYNATVQRLSKVLKPSFRDGNWLHAVETLEDNQKNFADYLSFIAARAPVFEVGYEDLDGPFQEKWLSAILGFLGVKLSVVSFPALNTIKVGGRACEDRIDHLGVDYQALKNLASRKECFKLHSFQHRSNNMSNVPFLIGSDLYLPPSKSHCQLTPSCHQAKYTRYLFEIQKNK